MLIRCIFEYFQKKRKVLMINVMNSNIKVKMLLLVFNYIKCSYTLFKKGELYLSTVMCKISKFPKKLMQF